MFSFIVRLFMLLAALGTLGLTSLDILKDHMGVDTDALLRSGGNMALAAIADLADKWSGLIANLSGADTGTAGGERVGTSSVDAGGRGDAGGSLLIQIGFAAASILVLWLLIKFGRRKA